MKNIIDQASFTSLKIIINYKKKLYGKEMETYNVILKTLHMDIRIMFTGIVSMGGNYLIENLND